MRADMRRIATRQEQIVLPVKIMEKLATQTQPVSGKTNAQKSAAQKDPPAIPPHCASPSPPPSRGQRSIQHVLRHRLINIAFIDHDHARIDKLRRDFFSITPITV
ncbi:MAG: hypothetical protein CBARDCOR_0268 [uncultured Caballeronia sp.]|nr:MAG: hypothetical protein CBARDCOR_0268 [uncultured Caballeronia sp.]